jgi:hypothetical protein
LAVTVPKKKRWLGLILNPGDPWAKILTTNQFLFLKIILENIPCGPFLLHTTSKDCQVERLASQV